MGHGTAVPCDRHTGAVLRVAHITLCVRVCVTGCSTRTLSKVLGNGCVGEGAVQVRGVAVVARCVLIEAIGNAAQSSWRKHAERPSSPMLVMQGKNV